MNTNIPTQYPFQSQNPYGNSQAYIRQVPIDTRYDSPPYQAVPQAPYAMPSIVQPPQTTYIKCRPVASIDEARASQVDLDGSLNVFTDIGNKKIYTKQINIDGTASLNTYCLTQDKEEPKVEFITRQEFDAVIKEFQNLILNMQAQVPTPQPAEQKTISF